MKKAKTGLSALAIAGVLIITVGAEEPWPFTPVEIVEYEPYPDEARLLARVEQDPNPHSIAGLARVRLRRAMELAEDVDPVEDSDRYAKALSYAESAAELDPANIQARLLLTGLYLLASDDNPLAEVMAETHAQAVLDAQPEHPQALAAMVELSLASGFNDEALTWFERRLSVDPSAREPETILRAVETYLSDDQQQRGALFFEQLHRQHPEHALVIARAMLLAADDNAREALALMRQVANAPQASADDRAFAEEWVDQWTAAGRTP